MSARNSRERTPQSGRSNLSSSSSARDYHLIQKKVAADLNEPLIVNRGYCGTDELLIAERNGTLLPPSKFPTVPPPSPQNRKVLSCPTTWVDEASNPIKPPSKSLTKDDKFKMSTQFIENNLGRMQEYRTEYLGKSPSAVRELIMDTDTDQFLPLWNELQHKQRARKKGTSSFQLRRCLEDDHLTSIREFQYDPYIQRLPSSREDRGRRMQTLFAPETHLHATEKPHNRGYRHAPEYGNFSNFKGHLIKNQGTMLDR